MNFPEKLSDYYGAILNEIYQTINNSQPVLENASVIGENFDEEMLLDILEDDNLNKILRKIETNYKIINYLINISGNWFFSHITWRDYIYKTLVNKSNVIHKKIANYYLKNNFIDYSKISYHYKNAGDNSNYYKFMIKHARELVTSGQIFSAEKVIQELEDNKWKQNITSDFEYFETILLLNFFKSNFEMCIQLINENKPQFKYNNHKILIYIIKAKCLNKSNKNQDFIQAKEIILKLISYLNKDTNKNNLVIGQLYSELIVSYSHLNNFIHAKHCYEKAETYLIKSNNKIELANLWRKSCIFFENELSEMILKKAIKICDEEKNELEKLKIYNNLGVVYLNQNKLEKAFLILKEAIDLNIAYGKDYILNNIGIYYIKCGQLNKAYKSFCWAKELSKRAVCNLIISTNIAAVELAKQNISNSEESLKRLLADASLSQEDVYLIIIRFNLIEIYILQNLPKLALKELFKCDISNLQNLGSYYVDIKKKLILKTLNLLGAIKINICDIKLIQFNSENFYYTDMEFWGD